jgi:hypothetical protein
LTDFFRFDDQALDPERGELRRAAGTEHASDEHGTLGISGAPNWFNIGDKIHAALMARP